MNMKEEKCILESFVYFNSDDEEKSTNDWEEAYQWIQDGIEVYAYIYLLNRNCITSPVEKLDTSKNFFITLTRGKTRIKYVIKRE